MTRAIISKRSKRKIAEDLKKFREVYSEDALYYLDVVRVLARIASEDTDLGERWLSRATAYFDDLTTALIEAEGGENG